MASLASTCRLTARLTRQRLAAESSRRGLHTLRPLLAAQNFTMPALSPTMTEGNIASWRVKEGDSFSAGDVLLEIETDKATMDVEAQDDGIMMKIFAQDGSKAVAVGTRIGVLAEDGDDISTLEIPADTGSQATQKPQEAKESSPEKRQEVNEPAKAADAQKKAVEAAEEGTENAQKTVRLAQKQHYPLFPSVEQLLLANGIDKSKVSEMTPTGPNGRLLKGDVLVYLGKIGAKAAAQGEKIYNERSHLDLRNIKPAAPKEQAAAIAGGAPAPGSGGPSPAASTPSPNLQISLPISLTSVLEAQNKFQTSLGTPIPLATFIARASEVANDALPLPADAKPSADELFNAVLGLGRPGGIKASRGHYLPQMSSFGGAPRPRAAAAAARSNDIYDLLTSKSKNKRQSVRMPGTAKMPGSAAGVNVFSLSVPRAEEKRAKVFLERVKYVLETEPGRLMI